MKLRYDLNTPEVREALEKWVDGTARAGQINGGVNKLLLDAISAPEPLEPPIPWEYLDERWQWMAMDSNGEWWGYTKEPAEPDSCGWAARGRCDLLPCPPGSDRHWTETLIRRPE